MLSNFRSKVCVFFAILQLQENHSKGTHPWQQIKWKSPAVQTLNYTHQIGIKITRYFEKKVITIIYCHLTIVKESICSNKVYPEVKKHENNNSKGGFNDMCKSGLPCHFH